MADTLIGIFLETVSSLRKPAQFMRKVEGAWESIPAERALADVESLGLALREMGVGPGDRVAILSENRYEWPVSDLAILGLGAVTVPIYPTLTAAQCRFVLENSEAKVAIVSTQGQLVKIHTAAEGLPGLRSIIHMDVAPGTGPLDRHLVAALDRGRQLLASDPGAFRAAASTVKPDDLATIIYTSGTTGEPKGAMLTHHNIAWDVAASLKVIDLKPEDTCLSFLPLCHIFERMAGLYAMLARGVTIAYAGSVDTVAADAVEVRPTVLIGVPRFYEKVYARVIEGAKAHPPLARKLFSWALANLSGAARARFERRAVPPLTALQARLGDRLVAGKIRDRVGGRLRFCVSGGAPLSAHVMEFFFAIGIPVMEGYGLTETSPVICLNVPGREKPGSVGPAIPGVEVKIGEEGEILTRGPHVMRGYFRNDEATRLAIRDGWFHTGDVGHLDGEGCLFITDRLKDLLVLAGGKKVAPQPLEARLKRGRWVTEAVLIGDRRPFVTALLVPNFANLESEAKERGWTYDSPAALAGRPEARALVEAEVAALNSELAPFEQIRRFALLDRELTQDGGELTPTLKVKRRVIAERFSKQIETLYVGHSEPVGV